MNPRFVLKCMLNDNYKDSINRIEENKAKK